MFEIGLLREREGIETTDYLKNRFVEFCNARFIANLEARYYTEDAPPSEAAPLFRMEEQRQLINKLAEFLPIRERAAFKARAVAGFKAAAGIPLNPHEGVPALISHLAEFLPIDEREHFSKRVFADYQAALGVPPHLGVDAAARRREAAATETTARAKEPPRPDDAAAPAATAAAPDLEWPNEKWKGSPEELSRKRYQIVAFLRRVWKPFIDKNNVVVTRQVLMERDKAAALALKGYLRAHDMPDDVGIVSDKQLKQYISDRPTRLQNQLFQNVQSARS